jgi:hypothetical protein
MWAKPVNLEHIKGVLASDLSGVEFATYLYGLLRSGKNGEFYSVLPDVAKWTGHDTKRISAANTSLCERNLFVHTRKFHKRKYPIFHVPMPNSSTATTPIPISLREKIHLLRSGALRLLLLLIVKGGWSSPFGCVTPLTSAQSLAADAGISEASANTAMWYLKENGWIAYELPYGQLEEVFALRGWRALITITQKAGFIVPPLVSMKDRIKFLITLGSGEVYPAFDKRIFEGALQHRSPKMRNRKPKSSPKMRNGSLQK